MPLSVFAAILAAMALIAVSASATKTHPFKEVFGSAAQPSFGSARGVAIDQSSGDVLVMDASGTASIKRYNADGTPDDFPALGTNVIDGQGTGDETPQNALSFASANELQIAVDNSGGATDGDIYVTQSSPKAINIFSSAGAYLGQLTKAGVTNFSEACGVAVDLSGAVYVGDYGGGIHKFVPAANPPLNTDNTANFSTVSPPCTLAAGAGRYIKAWTPLLDEPLEGPVCLRSSNHKLPDLVFDLHGSSTSRWRPGSTRSTEGSGRLLKKHRTLRSPKCC